LGKSKGKGGRKGKGKSGEKGSKEKGSKEKGSKYKYPSPRGSIALSQAQRTVAPGTPPDAEAGPATPRIKPTFLEKMEMDFDEIAAAEGMDGEPLADDPYMQEGAEGEEEMPPRKGKGKGSKKGRKSKHGRMSKGQRKGLSRSEQKARDVWEYGEYQFPMKQSRKFAKSAYSTYPNARPLSRGKWDSKKW
jgi:hypothetical protein